MTAEKENKVYSISKAEKESYQKQGFDIVEDGKIILHGKGKTVNYDEHKALLAQYTILEEENEALKEENETLKKGIKQVRQGEEMSTDKKPKKEGA